MDKKLEEKLRQLGVAKGSRHLRPASKPPQPVAKQPVILPKAPYYTAEATDDGEAVPLTHLLPGLQEQESDWGSCLVRDQVYPLSYQHGGYALDQFFDLEAGLVKLLSRAEEGIELPLNKLLFIDTETTGLSGAGALAFMVGAAFFTEKALIVRQYFLRDPGDEPAMLSLLNELAEEMAGVVSFNGRSFDLPLLDTRFMMNRMVSTLPEMPHLDLLTPSRRLWRRRLDSCALSSLEIDILGVKRTHEDVPGWLIPGMYNDFVRGGDGRGMQRVFYHNEIDMLSMVTLAARIGRQMSRPAIEDDPEDLYSLGRWQMQQGDRPLAEKNLLLLLQRDDLPLKLYQDSLSLLAAIYKKAERWDAALPLWQQLAVTALDDVAAHVELAKYYEWQADTPTVALEWCNQAISLVGRWLPSRAALSLPGLEHRRKRLLRKLS